MEVLLQAKAISLTALLFFGSYGGYAANTLTAALQRLTSQRVQVVNFPSPDEPSIVVKVRRIKLGQVASANIVEEQPIEPSPEPSPSPTPQTQPRRNPFQKPTAIPTPPKPKPTPAASSTTIAPSATPTPLPTTETPIPSPDFTVGALIITDYTMPSVKVGEPFPFKVFVRDTTDRIIKNTVLAFAVNGKVQHAATDDNGKAPLEFSDTQTAGKVIIEVALGAKSTKLTIEVFDTKPNLARSPVGCSHDGCHIRLGNSASEWVSNWTVTARSPADSTYLSRTKTDGFGLATFPLPPRLNSTSACPEASATTYCICLDVENIGEKCGGF